MMRTVFGAFLALAASLAVAQEASPAAPAASAAPVRSPALDRRIREARATGTWVVEEGETLYSISRHFAADQNEARVLEREFRDLNAAVVNGAAGATPRVGARLRLPPRLALAPAASLTPGSLPETSEPGRATPPRATVVGPPVYVDQLIGGASAEDAERVEAGPRDDSPGLRSMALEYRIDRRTQLDRPGTLAQGLALRHRAETERLGDFSVEGELGRETGVRVPGGEPRRDVGRVTLFHDQFALTPELVASSALGAVRLALSPWIASAARVQLPSSVGSGFTTQLDAPHYQLRASYGRLARLTGVVIQDLDLVPGSLATIEAGMRLSERWRVGAAAVSLQGAEGIRDHAAATLAAEYAGPGLPRLKVHALADDRGETAFWADAEVRAARTSHRLGAFQVEPQVVFGEGSLLRDSRGAYWRADHRAARFTTTSGVELNQTNLARDPERGGLTSTGAFGNLSLKLDRATNVGAGLSLRDERPRTGRGVRRGVGLLTAFGSRLFPWGLTRLDLGVNATAPRGLPTESTRSASLSHEWPTWRNLTLSTMVSFNDERFQERRVRRSTAGISLRGPLFEEAHWDAALTFVDVDDPLAMQRNYNAAVGLDWSPARDWVVRMQWLRNQVEPTTPSPFAPFLRENVVQLSARYEETSGTPYPRVAAPGGRSGTGWIEGVVFFDENGDGVRQANERGAPGVAVMLNARSVQMTDAGGRYNFGLVGSGEHRITLSVERVPLPWGLQDDAPRPVRVEVREGTRLDIPLNRITP